METMKGSFLVYWRLKQQKNKRKKEFFLSFVFFLCFFVIDNVKESLPFFFLATLKNLWKLFFPLLPISHLTPSIFVTFFFIRKEKKVNGEKKQYTKTVNVFVLVEVSLKTVNKNRLLLMKRFLYYHRHRCAQNYTYTYLPTHQPTHAHTHTQIRR